MFARIERSIIAIGLGLLSISIGFLTGYGGVQLYIRSDRLDIVESQKAEIANLETKVVFLQNNDWALIIEQLPPIIQDELRAMNERIKQRKHREYERFEQPLISEEERSQSLWKKLLGIIQQK